MCLFYHAPYHGQCLCFAEIMEFSSKERPQLQPAIQTVCISLCSRLACIRNCNYVPCQVSLKGERTKIKNFNVPDMATEGTGSKLIMGPLMYNLGAFCVMILVGDACCFQVLC